jgi:hypothetical protein
MIGIKYGIYWLPDNSDLLVISLCVLMIVVSASVCIKNWRHI